MKIGKGSLLIWHVKLDEHVVHKDYFSALLSTHEKARAASFRFKQDCVYFIIARGILRHLIGQLVQQAPERLQFAYNVNGKPRLQLNNRLQFNLSHTNGQAIYAFTYGIPVGVDVEYRNPCCPVEDIARRFFTAEEYYSLQNLTAQSKVQAFFSAWVQKEAVLKALGLGLFDPLSKIEVALSPAPMRLIAIYGQRFESERWLLQSVSPAPNFEAAVAVPMPHLQLEVKTLHAVQLR